MTNCEKLRNSIYLVRNSIYLFDLYSKNKNSNLSNFGEAVLSKFDKLYSLENSIRSVYYNAYPMTVYFKIQYLKVHCTFNARSAVKCSLIRVNYQQSGREIWIFKKNVMKIQKRKDRKRERDMMIKKNLCSSIKKCVENQILHIRRQSMRKTLKYYWQKKMFHSHCRIVSTSESIWWIII